MSTKRITIIDYTILGLLYEGPQTGYGIRKLFETTALGDFSSSPGTVYPAIKKLKEIGFVLHIRPADDNVKLLGLTKEGRTELKSWLLREIDMSDIKKNINHLVLRFAFMSDIVTQEARIRFMESFYEQVSDYLKELKSYYHKNSKSMPVQGRLAFKHGLETYKANLKWAKYTYSQLQNIKKL